jgi:hypothetical protein
LLSDEQILAAIDAAEAAAFGPKSTEIASDRADALDRYMGKPYGDEKPGRSQVVSRDVSDVVEGVCANVLKPFVGGDRVVVFNPRGPEDEAAAQQETDYINFVVMERNNGFIVLNSAVKDALLLRNGYVKLGWTSRQDITVEKYRGLSDEELALLQEDGDVDVSITAEYPDPSFSAPQMLDQMGMPVPGPGAPTLFDVTARRKQATEYVECMPVPPDELLVSQRANEPSLQPADFVQHRPQKTISELRELGYDIPDDISDDEEGAAFDLEDYARNLFSSEVDGQDPTALAARRLVTYKESWLRIDKDGDGIAELRRVCSVGKNILKYKGGKTADEEADMIPIACFVPILMSHRHHGISVYDLVKDIAETKTTLVRSFLDNRYLQNNAEKVVNVNAVENIDDFLTSRPGGIKRVRGSPGDAVMPLVVPDTGSGALMALEYMDSIRENRTGYTKTAQGMKSGSLATDTLGELENQWSQSSIRLEMIARTVAETGMRDLFRIAHALTLKHSSRSEKIKLRNSWAVVNPREWVRRTDLSISVGLGSTTGPQQMQNLGLIGQAQQQAMPLGIVTPENVYNTAAKMATAAGFKNPEEFFTKPEKTPKLDEQGQPVMGQDGQPVMESKQPPPPKDPAVQAEEIKAQTQMQLEPMKLQAQQQIEQQKTQNNVQQAQFEAQTSAQLEEYKINKQAELERFKVEQQAELERYKADLNAQVELQKAQISAGAQIRSSYKKQTGKDEMPEEEDQKRVQAEERENNRDMSIQEIRAMVRDMVEEASSPVVLERDRTGRVAAVTKGKRKRTIQRGPDGGIAGIQ